MQFHRPFSDKRLAGSCVYCRERPGTRDHVPASVFLDKPYPTNLPVVESCRECNQDASLDEEYVACLIGFASEGAGASSHRAKVARILDRKPALAALVAQHVAVGADSVTFAPDDERLSRVLSKVARGLATFETAVATNADVSLRYTPLLELDEASRDRYYAVAVPELLPEIGSRMMQRVLVTDEQRVTNLWEELQPERFAYAVEVLGDVTRVKFVVGEFLTVEADVWPAD